jgi:hypothetical protein
VVLLLLLECDAALLEKQFVTYQTAAPSASGSSSPRRLSAQNIASDLPSDTITQPR